MASSTQVPAQGSATPAVEPDAFVAEWRQELEAKAVEFRCPVCFEIKLEQLQAFPCRHHFCGACLDRWQQQHHTCPICRQGITSSAVDTAWIDRLWWDHPVLCKLMEEKEFTDKRPPVGEYLQWMADQWPCGDNDHDIGHLRRVWGETLQRRGNRGPFLLPSTLSTTGTCLVLLRLVGLEVHVRACD